MPGVETLEKFDNFAGLRNGLRDLAATREGHWAGIPMPLDDQKLILSPKYPHAAGLMAMGAAEPEPAPDDFHVRNKFYSHARRCDVLVFEEKGKINWGLLPACHHFAFDLQTLGCSYAWGLEQEHNAILLLGELIAHHQLKQYLLTGMFLEKSKRSGITYVFRKLRPTVALGLDKEKDTHTILCCLCLHTLGYYQGSWAGAMCPTDDVISHLLLMRADEHMFWKSSNQHEAHRPEAGL